MQWLVLSEMRPILSQGTPSVCGRCHGQPLVSCTRHLRRIPLPPVSHRHMANQDLQRRGLAGLSWAKSCFPRKTSTRFLGCVGSGQPLCQTRQRWRVETKSFIQPFLAAIAPPASTQRQRKQTLCVMLRPLVLRGRGFSPQRQRRNLPHPRLHRTFAGPTSIAMARNAGSHPTRNMAPPHQQPPCPGASMTPSSLPGRTGTVTEQDDNPTASSSVREVWRHVFV